ncbi:OsmC family protein [Gynurincola endophyticus]|jgi:putative redox protein|uniref:OsmC family protein n=1 Tax=Gynurincola endophyticus TaxID=2479004 RepID=UPI000F8CE066|nr:OsmC family protein [Gynurincola endophyticus]
MISINLKRVAGDYGFEATDAQGKVVKIDNSPDGGGIDFGARPMQLLLMGLGGCSGIDIVSILKKQRQEITDFEMSIEGEREAGKEPSLWKEINIVFSLKGEIEPGKAHRACALSMEKYCSVAETLRLAGGNIQWKLIVNDVPFQVD